MPAIHMMTIHIRSFGTFFYRGSVISENNHAENAEKLVDTVLLLPAAVFGIARGSLCVDSDVSLHKKYCVADLFLCAVLGLHHRQIMVRIERHRNDGLLSEIEHYILSFSYSAMPRLY